MQLTDEKVQEVIEEFWQLNASKAPIKDFLPFVSPDIYIELGFMDIKFKGIAEFADHQIGKLCFFDQSFELLSISTTIADDIATSETKGVWYASTWVQNAAYSQKLIADVNHTWKIRASRDTNRAIMLGHVCDAMKYREGFAPRATPEDFHLKIK
jgi:hypothetical protein